MATEIETWSFRGGTQCVTEISLAPGRLTLTVAPWEGDWPAATLEFRESRLLSIEIFADGSEDLILPWDVIGFDCSPHSETRWTFVLRFACVEYVFESLWPVLVVGGLASR